MVPSVSDLKPNACVKENTEWEESNWPDSRRNYFPPKHESTDISVLTQKMLHVDSFLYVNAFNV